MFTGSDLVLLTQEKKKLQVDLQMKKDRLHDTQKLQRDLTVGSVLKSDKNCHALTGESSGLSYLCCVGTEFASVSNKLINIYFLVIF